MSKKFSLRYKKNNSIKTCEFIVDDECVALVRGHVWSVNEDRNGNRYVFRPDNRSSTKEYFLHKQIAKCSEGFFVSFKNGNTLDLRRENLEVFPNSYKSTYANIRKGMKEVA